MELNQDNLGRPVEDPSLFSLVNIARFHSIAADAVQLKHLAATGNSHFSADDLLLAARSLGLKARSVAPRAATLGITPLPALAIDREGRHFILAKTDGKTALILEADMAAPIIRPLEEVVARRDRRMLLFASRASLTGDLARFEFSWFIPAVVRYRRLLLEVPGGSLVLRLCGLISTDVPGRIGEGADESHLQHLELRLRDVAHQFAIRNPGWQQ